MSVEVKVNHDVLNAARFVYSRYPELRTSFPFWRILSLLDKHEDNLVYIKENGEIKGAAFYVMIDDETLVKIINSEYDVSKSEDVAKILKAVGKNLHFVSVAADNIKIILKGLRKTIKYRKPDTISWFKPDMTLHFIKFRKADELCHLSHLRQQ